MGYYIVKNKDGHMMADVVKDGIKVFDLHILLYTGVMGVHSSYRVNNIKYFLSSSNELKIYYKDYLIQSYLNKNWPEVCESLNDFDKLSQVEINELYIKSLESKIDNQKSTIDSLINNNKALMDVILKYSNISVKIKELGALFTQVETQTKNTPQ
jgi:hypothetical protein